MADKKIPYKIYLTEDEMPNSWYNLRADMKNKPAPLLNPGTLEPLKAEELAPIFCEELVAQELDETTPYIEIPQEIRRTAAARLIRRRRQEGRGKKFGFAMSDTKAFSSPGTKPFPRAAGQRDRLRGSSPPRPARSQGLRGP